MDEGEVELINALADSWTEGEPISYSTRTKAKQTYKNYKEKEERVVWKLMDTLTLRKQAPRRLLAELSSGGWYYQTLDEKKAFLWSLGWDTRLYEFAEALGWYTHKDKREVGYYILGQERTDDEWVGMWRDGVRVATLEAQMFNKQDRSLSRELHNIRLGLHDETS